MKRIEKQVARVRWRHRWQLALRRLLVFGGAGLLLFGILVLLVKARALPTDWTYIGGAVAAALAVVGAISGLVRRLDDVRLAAELDAVGGLHSRLGTALAFAREPNPTPMQLAAIDDALTVVDRAQPSAAAPWQWATFAIGGAVAALAIAISVPSVFVLSFPVGRTAAIGVAPVGSAPAAFVRGKIGLDEAETEHLEVLEEAVEKHRAAAVDAEVKGFLDALDALVKALKEGEVTADEAFAKLAALEKAQEAWSEQHAEDLDHVRQALKEAAEKRRRGHQEDAEALLEALRKQALEEAAKSVESAADKLERGEMSTRERQRLARDLQHLAKSLESDRQKREREARRDRDRLKKKQEREKDRFSKRDRDRLKKKERELEQLRREQEQLSEARRQLERLQRDLDDAAAEMLKRMMDNGEQMTAEQLRRAAEMLRRMQEQAQGRQQMRAASGRMGDLRELLRRAGQRKRGGQGKDGEGGQSAMERFYARAGGQKPGDNGGKDGQGQQGQGKEGQGGQGKEGMMLGEGKGGQDKLTLVGLGQGPGQGTPMPGRGGQQAGSPQEGEGVGEGHDSRLLGERTHMDVKTKDDFVAGQQGAGESASRVVYSAASRGFASAAYRDVHQDYSEVVEDDLDRQKIPPGQRTYVRRYFDLIRPR